MGLQRVVPGIGGGGGDGIHHGDPLNDFSEDGVAVTQLGQPQRRIRMRYDKRELYRIMLVPLVRGSKPPRLIK